MLVDDLITRGVTEPYRMFTSRAEYRLQLREDNADLRLTEHGRRLGLVDDARWDAYCRKRDAVAKEHERLRSTRVSPASVPDSAVAEQVEIATKYEGYIDRQRDEISRHLVHEATRLPADLDYRAVRGLSVEVQQKLAHHRPETVGQASRISGVTPAAISLLLVHVRRLAAEANAPKARRA